MSAPPLLFDRALHRRRLDRAAGIHARADFLKRRAAEDAVENLEAILRDFPLAVDLGARTGAFRQALAASPAAARIGVVVETDLSAAMLAGRDGLRAVVDEERLPFRPGSVDLIVSLLALHWANDLPGALVQIRRSLKPDGLFIGAVLGGATLTELRWALMQAEIEVAGGAGPRVAPFADAWDGAALLQRAGFALPVADSDVLTVTYENAFRLMADLRGMGEQSALAEAPRGIAARALFVEAARLYQERHANADGRIRATFRILYLTGWAPADTQQKPLRPGSAAARLADALGTSEQAAGDKARPR